jgi:FAD:protein FMN transferase
MNESRWRALAVLATLTVWGCTRPAEPLVLSGPTMGTTYTVRWLAAPQSPPPFELRRQIEAELAHVDQQMSRYRSDSELSRFNHLRSSEWITASSDLAALVSEAKYLSAATAGAFDITIAPLIDAWGFGPQGAEQDIPDAAQIALLLQRRGPEMVEVQLAPPALRKRRVDVELDLNAIAPGHAVDRICRLLDQVRVDNYLVDVGGEIRVRGHNAEGRPWRVAIDDPRHREQVPYRFIELTDAAVATSGGYRHFYERQGRRYSHLLDARTGYPADLSVAAVVVIAPTAAQADGWATALFALGRKDGFAIASERRLAALFIVPEGDTLREYATPAVGAYRAP